MVPGFKGPEGRIPPIGRVREARGEVFVVHHGQTAAYRLKKDFPVFTNDTLVTGERSRVSVGLNDRSVFGLAPRSKLVINKSVYNPEKRKRSSMLSLLFGRARFIVAKLMGQKAADYRVKTPTAVCGVRGSDFALAVTPIQETASSGHSLLSHLQMVGTAHAQIAPGGLISTVVTGSNTTLTFQGLTGPIQIVAPNSLSAATFGSAAITVTGVSPAMATSILNGIATNLGAMGMPPGME